ncbi:MAG: PAS domain S-box protein [Pseudolabrys sp.]
MGDPKDQFGWLSDPRLAEHALSQAPVWLWSAQEPRLLWANPVAAGIFDAPSPAAVATLQFNEGHPAPAQIARLAGTLPAGGAPRLERLRGFGARLGGALICLCSRITLFDNSAAILVVSTERAGKDLPLAERAHRLLSDFTAPAAIFSADGEPIDSAPAARARFGDKHDLVALGAQALARATMLNGEAEGEIAAGPVAMLKLGAGATTALLLAFTQADARDERPAVVSPPTAPAAGEPRLRRLPFRFVWQMDADTRFTVGTAEFAKLIGPKTASALDKPWAELARELGIDPQNQVAQALASRGTWSGIVVLWPVDDSGERLPIEMSGLPVFDRDRRFTGYRGFGICRDVERLDTIAQRRAAPKPETEAKVLPFPVAPPPPEPEAPTLPTPTPEEASPSLSPGERSAFQELARELSQRLKNPPPAGAGVVDEPFVAPAPEPPRPARNGDGNGARDTQEGRAILDRLPVGILVYRLSSLIYANKTFLDWTGYATLDALAEAGGLDSLFIETTDTATADKDNGKTLTITTVNGKQKAVDGRLFSITWHGENALVLMIDTRPAGEDRGRAAAEAALRRLEEENFALKAVLDTATDGVLMLDRAGRVLSANRSAEALFGYDAAELAEMSLGELFVPERRRAVLDCLDRQARAEGARALDTGREAIGRVKQGGLVPLYITMGRIEDGGKLCAVLRDITVWKRSEEELINARQEAEKASTAKSEFLAKISHEIRTPLNAIIGFSEVMMDERFGPIENERYQQYLKDIHASGGHLIALLNDLLDLSKIEAGKLELTFVSIDLNAIVQQCVAMLQEEANRARVIIRSSLPANLPPIVADARSVRQIALNLLSNSIKFTGAGGQVIVSTAIDDAGDVVLRLRDTGSGMSEKELETALEPFRQLSTATRRDTTGTGLGLPITKALAEANHARFRITSQVHDGTLVEVAFPATRVLAQ